MEYFSLLVWLTYIYVMFTVFSVGVIKVLFCYGPLFNCKYFVCCLSFVISFFVMYFVAFYTEINGPVSLWQVFMKYAGNLWWQQAYVMILGIYLIIGHCFNYKVLYEKV